MSGFRFTRRVRLLPGVRLNFSKRGPSVTIGPRGAGVTLGKRQAAVNVGLGWGLFWRKVFWRKRGQ